MAAAVAPAALALIVAAQLAVAPARAALFDDDEARQRIEILKGRFDQLETSLSQRVTALESTVKSQGLVDLLHDVEDIKADIAKLRGQYEVLTYELEQSQKRGIVIPMPTDVVVATEFSSKAEADVKPVGNVSAEEMILDIGPDSAEAMSELIATAGTILWNGPVGVFEFEQFGEGTRTLAKAIARSKAFSLAGGGDTLAAIEKYGIEDSISYISTGGGAFLEFVEGKKLPAVDILEKRAA